MLLIQQILPTTFMSTFYPHEVVYYHIREEENLELYKCDMRFGRIYEVNLTQDGKHSAKHTIWFWVLW